MGRTKIDANFHQVAFTVREVRELMNLSSVGYVPTDPILLPSDHTKISRAQKRLAQVLSKGSKVPLEGADRQWGLRYFLSPTSFQPLSGQSRRLAQVTCERTAFTGDIDIHNSHAKVTGIGQPVSLPASIAFRSIGYQAEPLPGLVDLGIPFDRSLGIIPNDVHGRVLAPHLGPGAFSAGHVPGFYVAGWSKRGPTGVIASTMDDAFATADAIAQDWDSHAPFLQREHRRESTVLGWEGIKAEAEGRKLRRVSWVDWERIDAAERRRGLERGKAREKFTSVEEMLRVLD